MIKILFVCLGNICRSATAESIMKKIIKDNGETKNFFIDSAGILSVHQGERADSRMIYFAKQKGYELTSISRPIREYDFYDFDMIIGMDDNNIDDLKEKAPTEDCIYKIHKMTNYCTKKQYDYIPDPYYGGQEGFIRVIEILEDACEGLYEKIKKGK